MLSFILNDETIQTEMPEGMTVLDFIRYHKNLKGTKIGCREGDCGACTIMVGVAGAEGIQYQTMTSCLMPLHNAGGKHIVTIEGINPPRGQLTPVQQAFVEENGTQCGFCTVGFVLSLTCFCTTHYGGGYDEAISSMDGNICRCTGYKSIERVAQRMVSLLQRQDGASGISFAIEKGIVPSWFASIQERLSALAKQNPKAKSDIGHPVIMGGGTDLYVQRAEELPQAEVRYYFDQDHLKSIEEKNDRIEIGGSATVTDLLESAILHDCFPKLHQHLKLVSSTPIRNMATVAGNIVNASPIGDITIWLLAMDATVVLKNGYYREIPLCDFFEGYKRLAKTADEVVEKVYFKKPGKNSWFNFEKVSKRRYLDIASVNTAMMMTVENNIITEAHVSAGGVSPIPLYLKNTSSCLLHQPIPLEEEHQRELHALLQHEIHPITDVRGTEAYKRMLMRQLFNAHFIEYAADHV
jgi:xanthine dehydrogenase small subunit